MSHAADDAHHAESSDAEASRLDRLVRLLLEQPAGTTFVWSDDAETDDGILTGWLAVWAPELARPLELAAWVWTVVDPDEHHEDAGEDVDDPGPLTILLAPDAVGRAGVRGWLPSTVSGALEAWVRTHAGRDDVHFEYDPNLTSDWITQVVDELDRRDGFDAPVLEDSGGVLHQITEQEGVLWTRCGRSPEPEWSLVEAGLWLDPDWDEATTEHEMTRGCDACDAAGP